MSNKNEKNEKKPNRVSIDSLISVVDPGFSKGAVANFKDSAPCYYFGQFPPKNTGEWKKLDQQRASVVPPWIRQCIFITSQVGKLQNFCKPKIVV